MVIGYSVRSEVHIGCSLADYATSLGIWAPLDIWGVLPATGLEASSGVPLREKPRSRVNEAESRLCNWISHPNSAKERSTLNLQNGLETLDTVDYLVDYLE